MSEGDRISDDDAIVEDEAQELPPNTTQGELEELNGLLVRELCRKIREGTATGTELSTAAKLVVSHGVRPEVPVQEYYGYPEIKPEDWPVQM